MLSGKPPRESNYMEILDSAWLIHMLQKSASSPQQRLLSLFDILADWVDATNVRSQFAQTPHATPADAQFNRKHLLDYLGEQAQACGAQLPQALAQQLYFIALAALQQSQQTAEHANFRHAKLAAQALIAAQTEAEPRRYSLRTNRMRYSMAACALLLLLGAGALLQMQFGSYPSAMRPSATALRSLAAPDLYSEDAEAAPSPKHTADMYAYLEQMRKGDCHYIEALQIPDADKKVYIENVVGGRVPDNARDMALAQKYLQKISCNYTPMLMKNSVN